MNRTPNLLVNGKTHKTRRTLAASFPGTGSGTCSCTFHCRSLQSLHRDPQHKHTDRAMDPSSVRTGQDRTGSEQRQKTKNRETATSTKIGTYDKKQDIHEHAQHCARHKLVLFLVECRNFAHLCLLPCVPEHGVEQLYFFIDTVPSHAYQM